ncbi:ATP-binding protein [Micromonospora chersina]|uniref:ATP-binding protein n=1 Tax=Micromonospora chersina TaxID=47854 RepID=UPI0036B4E3E0
MGRRAEREMVDQLLAQARAGRSGALVVRGEAGIGKTALVEQARAYAVAAGFRVESSAGVEAEAHFAFASLHQLCGPMLDHLDALPDPQQTALGVALGLRAGPAPDRFLVALATLSLVAEAAEEGPLLCLVDDAQWLDEASAQVLAFVARRVAAERVALVFGLRDTGASVGHPLAGLPELRLEGLAESDARELLAGAVRTPLDDVVRDRIVAEARGNPLALLELPRGAALARLAGGFELPDAHNVPYRLEEAFRGRSAGLPTETQLLLLVAAADPTGDTELLWRAAAHLGISTDAAAPAEVAGLLEIGTRVRFRHPLVRSAVYQAATPPDRRRAHRALTAATDPRSDPDRRAWHRAQSVQGTDEETAAELERSADRARARGGLAATAAFMQRAAELTPQPSARARRALDAAQAMQEAGASEAAQEMLTVAAAQPLDDLMRARMKLLRAKLAFHLTRFSEVPEMLLDAAKSVASLDAALSRETYLDALDAAIMLGGPGRPRDAVRVAESARSAPPPSEPPTPADLLLEALVTTFTEGYEAGVPGLRRAARAFCDDPPPAHVAAETDERRWLWLASRAAIALFDDDLAHRLNSRNVRMARDAGALAVLPVALVNLSTNLLLEGDFARAEELAAEEAAITMAIGAAPMPFTRLALAAWRGNEAETIDLLTAVAHSADGRGVGAEVTWAEYASAVLHNGLGDYPTAVAAATRACEGDELPQSNCALPELVEAAARADRPDLAAAALDELDLRARVSGNPWGLGIAARSRALTSTGAVTEDHYREAIELLGACRITTHLARTHLVYGEWLRREGRRQDAREQLRTAHDLLTGMGADAFAARAARELRATGERPRQRTAQPTDALTAQELHIARLVATGATSREVATQLFLSPRTIEAHLRSIFRKLDITSRRQLKELKLP